ncbi:hypothetical protein [Atopococcus tabaci]|nr:hypothetical protein [Atopococcus tabaci]
MKKSKNGFTIFRPFFFVTVFPTDRVVALNSLFKRTTTLLV